MIRNPWDWYVSWYAFNRKIGMGNPLFRVISDGGMSDFKSTITNLINLGDDSLQSIRYRDALVSILPDSLQDNRGVGLTKNCIRGFVDNETGYYCWLYNRMIGNAKKDRLWVGRFENLNEDFINIMEALDVNEVLSIKEKLKQSERKNSSNHSHYSAYYDDELRDFISLKDQALIDKYFYSFELLTDSKKMINLPDCPSIDGQFKKLSDSEKRFLLIEDGIDVEPINKKLKQIPNQNWVESKSHDSYQYHQKNQSLALVSDDDFRHSNPTFLPNFNYFVDELEPILRIITKHFQNAGYVIRILMAKLPAAKTIAAHCDSGFSLLHCNRIHIPLTTNDKVTFSVGGEKKKMKVGEMWEINNATVHSVINEGETECIHLIIDWVNISTTMMQQAIFQGRPVLPDQPCVCGDRRLFKDCHGRFIS
jgi:hypothetical protein